MSGGVDYLLRVVVPDIAAHDAFYKRLIARIEIRDVSSLFAMEQIKYTTELRLDYLVLDKPALSRPFEGSRTETLQTVRDGSLMGGGCCG